MFTHPTIQTQKPTADGKKKNSLFLVFPWNKNSFSAQSKMKDQKSTEMKTATVTKTVWNIYFAYIAQKSSLSSSLKIHQPKKKGILPLIKSRKCQEMKFSKCSKTKQLLLCRSAEEQKGKREKAKKKKRKTTPTALFITAMITMWTIMWNIRIQT